MELGLGTAAVGRPHYINIKDTVDQFEGEDIFMDKGIQFIQSAYERGVRYFDTAPGYGVAEKILLKWLAIADASQVEIASKWGYTYVANFDPNSKVHEVKEHSVEKLREQWNYTKQFIPYLSTYQIHSATFETGVLQNEEILRELNDIKKEHGIIMGITTTGVNQVDVIKKALDIEVGGERLFGAYQVTYNVLDQSLAPVADLLKRESVRVIIKEALANGRIFLNENYPQYNGLYRVLGELAHKYGVGVDAVALKFCSQTVSPYVVLSGASNVAHLDANLKVSEFELSAEELNTLSNYTVTPTYYWAERKQLIWN